MHNFRGSFEDSSPFLWCACVHVPIHTHMHTNLKVQGVWLASRSIFWSSISHRVLSTFMSRKVNRLGADTGSYALIIWGMLD